MHLFVLTKLYSLGFLHIFSTFILLNKIFDNKINLIYITFFVICTHYCIVFIFISII